MKTLYLFILIVVNKQCISWKMDQCVLYVCEFGILC